jgi:hypothetical protein
MDYILHPGSLKIFQGPGVQGQGQGRGPEVQGQGQGPESKGQGQGQGQGLDNWSLRILEDKDFPRGQQVCH